MLFRRSGDCSAGEKSRRIFLEKKKKRALWFETKMLFRRSGTHSTGPKQAQNKSPECREDENIVSCLCLELISILNMPTMELSTEIASLALRAKKSRQIPKTPPVHYGFGPKCSKSVQKSTLRLFGTREVGFG